MYADLSFKSIPLSFPFIDFMPTHKTFGIAEGRINLIKSEDHNEGMKFKKFFRVFSLLRENLQ